MSGNIDEAEGDEQGFQRFVAEALALRGGKPYPPLETIEEAVADGPFSRSALYRLATTKQIEFVKVGARTRVVTMSRLRAAARLPRVSGKLAA